MANIRLLSRAIVGTQHGTATLTVTAAKSLPEVSTVSLRDSGGDSRLRDQVAFEITDPAELYKLAESLRVAADNMTTHMKSNTYRRKYNG